MYKITVTGVHYLSFYQVQEVMKLAAFRMDHLDGHDTLYPATRIDAEAVRDWLARKYIMFEADWAGTDQVKHQALDVLAQLKYEELVDEARLMSADYTGAELGPNDSGEIGVDSLIEDFFISGHDEAADEYVTAIYNRLKEIYKREHPTADQSGAEAPKDA